LSDESDRERESRVPRKAGQLLSAATWSLTRGDRTAAAAAIERLLGRVAAALCNGNSLAIADEIAVSHAVNHGCTRLSLRAAGVAAGPKGRSGSGGNLHAGERLGLSLARDRECLVVLNDICVVGRRSEMVGRRGTGDRGVADGRVGMKCMF
jgi:hypothetical protein